MLAAVNMLDMPRTEADIAAESWAMEEARRLVLQVIGTAPVRAYLFGSRATGQARRFSDIDIALEADAGEVDPDVLCALREAPEESCIPYEADVVDLAAADPDLVAEVRQNGVQWTV